VAKSAIEVVRRANRYVEETAPWSRIKEPDGKLRVGVVLASVCEAIRVVAVLISPIMPRSAREIWRLLGLAGDPTQVNLLSLRFDPTAAGERQTAEARPLFPRIETTEAAPATAEGR